MGYYVILYDYDLIVVPKPKATYVAGSTATARDVITKKNMTLYKTKKKVVFVISKTSIEKHPDRGFIS